MNLRAAQPAPGTNCVALISDVVDSRGHANRSALQEQLTTLVAALNEQHEPALLARFTISRGDEIQALLKRAEAIPDIVWFAGDFLGRTTMRFGFGLGPLDTPLRTLPTETDGPAWWFARDALKKAAVSNRTGGMFAGFGDDDVVLTAMSTLLDHIRRRFTPRQRQVACLLREGHGAVHIGNILGITRQAVYHHARGAGWAPYSEGEAAWRAVLRKYDWSCDWEMADGAPRRRR
jgi:hypothetical protein